MILLGSYFTGFFASIILVGACKFGFRIFAGRKSILTDFS